MTIRVTHFNPEVLLSAARRSHGVPNAKGNLVLFTVSSYSFTDHKHTTELRVLDLLSNESTLVSSAEGVRHPNWLDGNEILLLIAGEKGVTDVVVGEVDAFETTSVCGFFSCFGSIYHNDFHLMSKTKTLDRKRTVGTIDTSPNSLKLKKLDNGSYIFAVSAPTTPSGTLFNPDKEEKSHSSGRLYKTTFVRHWDTWITSNRNSIWYGNLSRSAGPDGSDWALSPLVNALKHTNLECSIPPFGGGDNFDLATEFLVFVAKDPNINPAFNTKVNVYLLELSSIASGKEPDPIKVDIAGFNGASSSPVFSPDGKQVVFLSMKENGYESDRNHIFLITDIFKPKLNVELFSDIDFVAKWDRSPSSLTWSQDGRTIYLVAEDKAHTSLFSLPATVSSASHKPKLLFQESGVSGKSLFSFLFFFGTL
jgi:hypothetical protein